MKLEAFLSKAEQKSITDAIRQAETCTSGEVRLHIDSTCKNDALSQACRVFKALKMHKTKERNGVLIYVAIESHKLAIVGDEGLHSHVGDHFWDEIKDRMVADFKANRRAEGLCRAIKAVGQSLQQYFPYQKDDQNELSDDISFGPIPSKSDPS